MLMIKDQCYNLIKTFYENRFAKRSGVSYMKHIDEGLFILESFGASEEAKAAYCIHPMVQADEDLISNQNIFQKIDTKILILAMEYRSVANEYLSTRIINNISEIRLSPIRDVNLMLLADKLQNFSDFLIYHYGKHSRSEELYVYFNNWLKRLSVVQYSHV